MLFQAPWQALSIVNGDRANRMSLWRHDGERWLMEFHQGTPIPEQ